MKRTSRYPDSRLCYPNRVKNNHARSAALYLIRQLTSEPVTSLAERYGGVSQAAISKTVQRAETRCATERSWNRHMARLMKSLQTPAGESIP